MANKPPTQTRVMLGMPDSPRSRHGIPALPDNATATTRQGSSPYVSVSATRKHPCANPFSPTLFK
ncbi:hypothetical protein BO82DRAFT_351411 [Aspergillus uvarum CBS 121591]|uniref:Uncharacterized protein n=1 Tax=Aspergillus uvarum CBS 121591 TaxID=1448315 RepID=A0A319D1X0_9EURO|nr:hypothetical protein BO82DRAFT_351411 [Aspergillus uvarum CBS 121591]PYH85053.1 hypothetical protein BO82DRAFT_351411 [Aspergillus uvarum CBS 121591]